jgi:hypothetical protein
LQHSPLSRLRSKELFSFSSDSCAILLPGEKIKPRPPASSRRGHNPNDSDDG